MPPVENTITPNLVALLKQAPKALERSIYEFGQTHVMVPAKEYTPVDYGTLRDSGLVDKPVSDNDSISVTLGFGGAAAAYAIYVHEDLDAKHDVGQAKFLQRALDEGAATFTAIVSANFARAIGW